MVAVVVVVVVKGPNVNITTQLKKAADTHPVVGRLPGQTPCSTGESPQNFLVLSRVL